MGLVTKFYKNLPAYKQKRHENSTAWEKTKIKRIEKFLRSCEIQNVKDIKQIKQKNFDTFMQLMSDTKSPETARQYALAVSEFAIRAHLPLRIRATRAKNRKINRKIDKILDLISQKIININEDTKLGLRDELLKIL